MSSSNYIPNSINAKCPLNISINIPEVIPDLRLSSENLRHSCCCCDADVEQTVISQYSDPANHYMKAGH